MSIVNYKASPTKQSTYNIMSSPMDTDNFFWADWIKQEREKLGWSQSNLAREAKINRQVVNDYEHHRRTNPDTEYLVKISIALGHPPDHLPRLAKQLPPLPKPDEEQRLITHLYTQLQTSTAKKQAREYLKFLTIQEEQGAYNTDG